MITLNAKAIETFSCLIQTQHISNSPAALIMSLELLDLDFVKEICALT